MFYLCMSVYNIFALVFLIGVICLLGITYVLFMKKYYYLHEEYLKTL